MATLTAGSAWAAEVSDQLREQLRSRGTAKVIVYFNDVETSPSKDQQSQESVIRRLQRNLESSNRVIDSLRLSESINIYSKNWISNSVSLEADQALVELFSRSPDVKRVLWDAPVEATQPIEADTQRPEEDEYTYGLRKLRIPEVRDVYGFTGAGVRIGNIDTGCDGTHPDLAGKIVLYKDFSGQSTTPVDTHGHGTHTAATMVGGNTSGTSIGIAPDAEIVIARGIAGNDTLTNLLNSMQWMIDPDGDPSTHDAPVVVSMSWHSGGGEQTPFYEAIEAMSQAGVIPNFSAGNSGTSGLTHPKEYPATLTNAATDADDNIADFSSRGPATYQGQEQKKPEWACPGVDVYSAKPGGGYTRMSGTSMAAPHGAGVIALLFQADPTLTPQQVREILQETAVDLGPAGWDGAFGAGRLDAFAAVSLVATGGKIHGRVTGAGGEGISFARIHVAERGYTAKVKDDGSYSLHLPEGSYTLTFSAFGYAETSQTVNMAADAEIKLDVALVSAAQTTISGQIAGNGIGVAARVTVVGTPIAPVEANSSGDYSVTLPAGTYRFQAAAFGFQVAVKEVTVPGGNADFNLEPLPAILLVDDDAGKEYQTFYKAALEALGKDFGVIERASAIIDETTIVPYRTVVWFTGDDYRATLDADDQSHLKAYLAHGGKLIVTGQEVGYDLKGSEFYKDTLKAAFNKDNSGSKNVSGLGLSFAIEGGDGANNQRYPDSMTALEGAEGILAYDNGQGAGLRIGNSVVYLSFGLEGVDTAENRAALLGKLFGFLAGDVAGEDAVRSAHRGVRRLDAFKSLHD